MIRTFAFAAAALALSTPALAQVTAALDRPTLRAEATVIGKVVRIGDLIEHAGIVANVPIFRAPDLGSTGTVPAARVVEAVRAHALIGLDPGGITDVTVTRASRTIAPSEIETTISAALARDYPLGDAADITLTFDRPLHTVHVEPTSRGMLRVTQLRFESRSGRFEATIEIADDASTKLRLSGGATATAEVLVVNRAFGRGEVIRLGDLTMQRRPRAEAGVDAIANPEQAIGFAARGTISTNRVLRASDLMRPELVQRNETVTITYEAPGVLLNMRGKAVDGGAEGDMIDVVNVLSKRVLRGTVTGPGRVAVMSMAARVTENEDSAPLTASATVNK